MVLLRSCSPAVTKSSLTLPLPPLLRPRFFSKMPIAQQRPNHHMFGPYKIRNEEIFLTTEHSFAFISATPVVPDVLISSKRVVPRFLDLTEEEAADLMLTSKRVGAKLELHFGATSLTIAIQDGIYAGQTVPHVHVHILPRKDGDFEVLDEVYDKLDVKERELKMHLESEYSERTDDLITETARLQEIFSSTTVPEEES